MAISCPLRFGDPAQTINASEEYYFKQKDDFVKSIQFSLDGSHLLASTEFGKFSIYSVPENIVDKNKFYLERSDVDGIPSTTDQKVNLIAHFGAGECIYDCKWYPSSISADPTR